ncbi:Hint domain-containing protein [Loktanella sp. IMCC34160]|uniref:Hint domain-containing protein n=1 Tax=Loktanella sp. IMCC34160 TaxID=2510646 RepID=UPI00101D8896|nr:Hint domain-containing protein [Loktanella sp. IMCC34160]RYG92892.1 Hint domain-containing protein [Loktanella sp. IMCC34160]
MKTGFHGTFVISWSQTELDGQWSAPFENLRVGAIWVWTGDPVRVDGPATVLTLGTATGETDLRRRAAMSVRRLLRAVDAPVADPARSGEITAPAFERSFNVTDGRSTWTVTLIDTGAGRPPLLMFTGEMPPRHAELWIVSHNIDLDQRDQSADLPGGVICFTPGTEILTERGPRLVEHLAEGDMIQTKDNGCQELLWIGQRRITGARLYAMPHLSPIRLREGALDKGVPDAGLLVSPDHRVMVRGAKARALFNCDEVLATARDLVNDETILVDHSVQEVTYIHLLLESHEVVFANSVETESFHPASAALDNLGLEEQTRLYDLLPVLRGDPQAYGNYARRVLSKSEAALLRHDGRYRAI